MSGNSVGKIVESICGKCNDVMGHTIMAMVGDEIVKVECRVCKSAHRFRPPKRTAAGKGGVTLKKGRDGEAVASRLSPPPASRPARPSQTKKLSAAMAAQEAWRDAVARGNRDAAKPYAISAAFETGEMVDHPVFGVGVVQAVMPPDKMDVLFEAGTKRLLCNKS